MALAGSALRASRSQRRACETVAVPELPTPLPFSIACVQTAPAFGATAANLAKLTALVADMPPTDLVVAPELCATGYSFADREEASTFGEDPGDGPTATWACETSRRTGGMVVAGCIERAAGALYNAAVVAVRGEIRGTYRKVHLFGFEREVFDPGDRPFEVFTFEAGDGTPARVGVMICFDWLFPEAARSLALQGADVIAHPSNLVTPGWCQKAMRVRAMENLVATATANRYGVEARPPRPQLRFTGESLIVAPDGSALETGPREGDALVRATIDRAQARLKVFASGNEPFAERRPALYTFGRP